MIRDNKMTCAWYDQWIAYDLKRIDDVARMRQRPAANATYEPQYVYQLAGDHLHLLLRRYSRGDPVAELCSHMSPLLDMWEEAERLGKSVWTPQQQFTRHAWRENLDHYVRCFWLTGLALALNLSEVDWQRLVVLMGNEGEDALLDSVIASRQPGRRIGASLCHPQPYERLFKVVQASQAEQAPLLRDFVSTWYADLDRQPKKGLSRATAMYDRPYWYDYDKADGAYFGFWCIEAVAVVKAFGIDDRLCIGLRNYPGDLLRPNGPSTHPADRAEEIRAEEVASQGPAQPKPGLGERIRRSLFASR